MLIKMLFFNLTKNLSLNQMKNLFDLMKIFILVVLMNNSFYNLINLKILNLNLLIMKIS